MRDDRERELAPDLVTASLSMTKMKEAMEEALGMLVPQTAGLPQLWDCPAGYQSNLQSLAPIIAIITARCVTSVLLNVER
jgi:hypothetical protein